MFKIIIIVLSISSLCVACKTKTEEKKVVWTKDQSAKFNKSMAEEEDLAIEVFLAAKPKWKITKTGTGLRYFIYEFSKGTLAQPGLTAIVKYKINLLDGKLCYQTENEETQDFRIDKSEIESGIQEGIKKMKVGEKAKLIIPSHLAHGLTGDQDKIPPLTTIVVDIELVALK